MTRPVLDTHSWVGWMLGSSGLAAGERETLDVLPPDQRPYLVATCRELEAPLLTHDRLIMQSRLVLRWRPHV